METLTGQPPARPDTVSSGGKQILLFSAGLDSFPAWHRLGKPPALYFDSDDPIEGDDVAFPDGYGAITGSGRRSAGA